ncbi:MAG: hypothetical protein C0168_11435 [Candidatus Aminicenantes bacterium]|nr:MAG: hypothetical protein C0168_11435 [Candidatus Aminicenantes bacterium]
MYRNSYCPKCSVNNIIDDWSLAAIGLLGLGLILLPTRILSVLFLKEIRNRGKKKKRLPWEKELKSSGAKNGLN